MRIFLFLIFIQHILQKAQGLKPDEICKLSNECNKPECTQSNCENIYPYSCGTHYCTVNRYLCQKFLIWTEVFNKFKEKQTVEKQINNYINFNQYIKTCPQKNWHINEVCLNTMKCAFKPQIWSLQYSKMKLSECPCKGKYSFRCGKEYCAVNQRGCDGLDKYSVKDIKKNITKCNRK